MKHVKSVTVPRKAICLGESPICTPGCCVENGKDLTGLVTALGIPAAIAAVLGKVEPDTSSNS